MGGKGKNSRLLLGRQDPGRVVGQRNVSRPAIPIRRIGHASGSRVEERAQARSLIESEIGETPHLLTPRTGTGRPGRAIKSAVRGVLDDSSPAVEIGAIRA